MTSTLPTEAPLQPTPWLPSSSREKHLLPLHRLCEPLLNTGLPGFGRHSDSQIQVTSMGEVYWQKVLRDTKDMFQSKSRGPQATAHFRFSRGDGPKAPYLCHSLWKALSLLGSGPKQAFLLPTWFLKISVLNDVRVPGAGVVSPLV